MPLLTSICNCRRKVIHMSICYKNNYQLFLKVFGPNCYVYNKEQNKGNNVKQRLLCRRTRLLVWHIFCCVLYFFRLFSLFGNIKAVNKPRQTFYGTQNRHKCNTFWEMNKYLTGIWSRWFMTIRVYDVHRSLVLMYSTVLSSRFLT